MKKMTIAAAAVGILTVGIIVVVAQMSHNGGIGQHFNGFANHHEQMLNHVSAELKLNDQQRTQAKQIMEDCKPRIEPLLQRLKESYKASADLGANGVFDEKRSQEVAAQQAEIIKQLLIEKEKTKAAFFAVLTSEQREQAKQLLNDFVENFGH